jgi:hypothetical protein
MPVTIPEPKTLIPEGYSAEQESVFDPLHETLLKKAVRAMGYDQPESAMESLFPASPLVAGVAPSMIPALRAKGKALLDKVLKEGLEQRSMGMRTIKDLDRKWDFDRKGLPIPDDVYYPNDPVPEELAKALTYAQRKYPRIFGHLDDISQVDALNQSKTGGRVMGQITPVNEWVPPAERVNPDAFEEAFKNTKFSKLGLNPKLMEVVESEPASTVGHELLHAADNIVNPNWANSGYQKSMELPGGYSGSAFEARANVQGERFANAMKGVPNPKPKSLDAIEEELLSRHKPELSPLDQLPDKDPIEWLLEKVGWK